MSIGHLHDDLLLYLAKYLSANDCLSLALSDANERFSFLYGYNRTRLALRECYFISSNPWQRFFTEYITHSSITVCDVSHCYWLETKVLCHCIKRMPNLEELYIQDTKMSLTKMPKVFAAYQKIVKLSITLMEDNLDKFQKGVMEEATLKILKNGFRKITHLKLFAFVVPNEGQMYGSTKSWLVLFGVLKWCQDCIDLLISITYKETNCSTNEEDVDDEVLKRELIPYLTWMKRLKSLVILLGSHSQSDVVDDSTREFILSWLPDIPAESLERLWVTTSMNYDSYDHGLIGDIGGSTVKSIVTQFNDIELDADFCVLYKDRFRHLEHLADILFDYVEDGLEQLTELKYVRGECMSSTEMLNDFCTYHPNLEQLHFSLQNDREADLNLGIWNLPLLKILVYRCSKLSQSVMDHLVEACPNIEQLHIDFEQSLSRTSSITIFSTIQFQNLKWLTINSYRGDLFDGSYLLSIVEHCPKLEKLHLKGDIEATDFFLHLAKCFPSVRNLRDLRVQWKHLQEDLSQLPSFFKALKPCQNLTRLVLFAVTDSWKQSPIHYATQFQDSILPFVKEMPHLVALCLAGFPIESSVVEGQFVAEIVPDRPAFWFHLGPELPKASDISVPRIHHEGIVYPIDPYDAPPLF